MKKQALIALALVALFALVAASGASAANSKKSATAGKVAGKEGAALMRALDGNAVMGTSLLRYRGRKGGQLKGWVIVTGLAANSTHAWHIHGRVRGGAPAPGNCKTQSDGVVVAFADLVANANGVAIVRVNVKGIGKNPLLKGNYVNIHEMSSADGVGLGTVCGMIKKAIV